MRILVTGAAGFIGSHLSERLIAEDHRVVGIDNFDSFYDPAIKRENVRELLTRHSFALLEQDIRNVDDIRRSLTADSFVPDVIVHLAARAGVRPSIQDPLLYASVNVDGTVAMLELARELGVRRFVFASSSSVYGNSPIVPFSEADSVDEPISPYAATKRAGELLARTYHHLYGISVVCLRFFTVYGPRQRPDLAIHKFARLMDAGEPVPMYGDGGSQRDYTYIDDIISGTVAAVGLTRNAGFEVVNLGGNRTTSLARLIELLSGSMKCEPIVQRLDPQPGDVERTYADITRASELLGYAPSTPIEAGITRFVDWFYRSRVRMR